MVYISMTIGVIKIGQKLQSYFLLVDGCSVFRLNGFNEGSQTRSGLQAISVG